MRPSTNKSQINEWEARYTSASEHVERLTPSLLAKDKSAVELAGQDAGDESAAGTAERIRQVKENRIE
ncbi:MAG: hypothetical protein IH589_05190 [Anaerolineales bacterium]|nr:hypothetical protein [Anaerolineales bacterium]